MNEQYKPEIGACKHVEFKLIDGCPECMTERRREAGITPDQDEMEDGLNREGYTLAGAAKEAGAEVTEVNLYPETAVIQIRPDQNQSVVKLYEESVKLLGYANARDIQTEEVAKEATDDLAIIAGIQQSIEEYRTSYTRPINDHLKAVNQVFKDYTAPLNEANVVNRRKVLAYRQAVEARIQEEERINRLRMEAAQAEAAINNGEISESVQVIETTAPAPRITRTGMGSSSTVDRWKAEVTDFALLPDEYKLENTQMLNAFARTHKGKRSIPGVRFYNDPGLLVNRKKVE